MPCIVVGSYRKYQTCGCCNKTHLLSQQKYACRDESFVTNLFMFVMGGKNLM